MRVNRIIRSASASSATHFLNPRRDYVEVVVPTQPKVVDRPSDHPATRISFGPNGSEIIAPHKITNQTTTPRTDPRRKSIETASRRSVEPSRRSVEPSRRSVEPNRRGVEPNRRGVEPNHRVEEMEFKTPCSVFPERSRRVGPNEEIGCYVMSRCNLRGGVSPNQSRLISPQRPDTPSYSIRRSTRRSLSRSRSDREVIAVGDSFADVIEQSSENPILRSAVEGQTISIPSVLVDKTFDLPGFINLGRNRGETMIVLPPSSEIAPSDQEDSHKDSTVVDRNPPETPDQLHLLEGSLQDPAEAKQVDFRLASRSNLTMSVANWRAFDESPDEDENPRSSSHVMFGPRATDSPIKRKRNHIRPKEAETLYRNHRLAEGERLKNKNIVTSMNHNRLPSGPVDNNYQIGSRFMLNTQSSGRHSRQYSQNKGVSGGGKTQKVRQQSIYGDGSTFCDSRSAYGMVIGDFGRATGSSRLKADPPVHAKLAPPQTHNVAPQKATRTSLAVPRANGDESLLKRTLGSTPIEGRRSESPWPNKNSAPLTPASVLKMVAEYSRESRGATPLRELNRKSLASFTPG